MSSLKFDRVEVVTRPSVDEFRKKYLIQGQPVIIRDATEHLRGEPALWTLDYLAEKCGDNIVPVMKFSTSLAVPSSSETILFRDYIVLLRKGQTAFPRFYLKNRPVHDILPQLADKVLPPPYVEFGSVSPQMQRRSTHIYIGRDAQTTMHFHAGDESISSVIQGRKEFILFPPSETKYLSPFPLHAVGRLNQSRLEFWRNEAINHANLDRAHGYKCELGPGEMIYIPVHWWHAVYTMDEPAIMLVHFFPSSFRRWWHHPQAARSLITRASKTILEGRARLRAAAHCRYGPGASAHRRTQR